MPRAYLADLAEDLLAIAATGVTQPMTGVPAPAKQFVSIADPVADLSGCCDDANGGGTLAVHIGGPGASDPLLFPASSTKPQAPCHTITNAVFTVTLLRCYPAIDEDQPDGAPTATVLGQIARQRLVDLWCLVDKLREAIRSGDWGEQCATTRMTQVRQVAPQGGCMGWQVVIQVQANDQGVGVGS